jgi:hypothetical protein
MRGDDTTPARESDSAAVLKLEPAGIITRVLPLRVEPPQPATTVSAAVHTVAAIRRLTWERERMLEEHSGSDGIDISFSSSSRATHLTNSPKGRRGREPLVHETHGHASAFLQLGSDVACLDGARRVLAVLIERQADDESLDGELVASPNHFGDRRSLAAAAFDEAGW